MFIIKRKLLKMKILIWFHKDLRTYDHEILNWVTSQNHEAIGVVFSPLKNSGDKKLIFWNETVSELKISLNKLNIPLLILTDHPLKLIPEIVREHKFDEVMTHRRFNKRDQELVLHLQNKLPIPVREMGDLTLFRFRDGASLTLKDLRPFTKFKNFVTSNWEVPPPLSNPKDKNSFLRHINFLQGGESAGLHRLKNYLWDTKSVLHYHKTRNGLLKWDDSSKFSPWLAWGTLSPRFIYQELIHLKKLTSPNDGIDALIYELIWRDYFKFLSLIQGKSFFEQQGLSEKKLEVISDSKLFNRWCRGETPEDFVNANMKELYLTGWMSNRGRQNVASYLAKKLKLDWTLGAQWFESQLIDEDTENNYGNWQYLAGVGTDPRDRIFDIKRQSTIYDPEGEYQKRWSQKTLPIEEP
jgi:deoxyribodipyrimidine photo-lyase